MREKSVARRSPIFVRVTADPIDVADLTAFVSDAGAGSSVVFTGTVRDHSDGREGVTKLEYEAYGAVAVEKITEIAYEALARWPIIRVAAVHRVGSLDVEEAAVCVAVSSAHRRDGFDACRYVIDELKSRVPIWKKEHWPDGAEWVQEGG